MWSCCKGTTKLPLQVDWPSNWVTEWQREPLGGASLLQQSPAASQRESYSPQPPPPQPGEECHLPHLSMATVVQRGPGASTSPQPRKWCSQDSSSLFCSWKQSLISGQRLRTVGRAGGHSHLTTRFPKTISTIRAAAPGPLLLSTLLPGAAGVSHPQGFCKSIINLPDWQGRVELLGEWLWSQCSSLLWLITLRLTGP